VKLLLRRIKPLTMTVFQIKRVIIVIGFISLSTYFIRNFLINHYNNGDSIKRYYFIFIDMFYYEQAGQINYCTPRRRYKQKFKQS
jgi:hypothetical protein